MATKTYTGLTSVIAGNLDDTALVPVADKNGNTRKATVAQMRTAILLGGTSSVGKLTVGDGTTTGGFGAAGTLGLVSSVTSTSAGGALNGNFYIKQTVASAGTIQGVEGYAHFAHTAGAVAQAVAVVANIEMDGVGGTLARAICVGGGGIIRNGTVTEFIGLNASGPGLVGGSIGILYGVQIGAQTVGAVNWAIYCASSATSGGTTFRNTALATNATVGHLFIPSCAGTPTGVPANIPTGQIAFQYDTSANKLWAYNGSWRMVAVV